MARIKSKSNVGVYREVLINGDISYYYTYKDIDGKKRWIKVGRQSNGYSERDAVVQRRKTITELENAQEPLYFKKHKRQEIVTLNQLAYYYFDEKREIKNYRDAYLKYQNHIAPVLGSENIQMLKADKIQKLKIILLEKGYKGSTVNYILSQLKTIINYAIYMERINIINPCTKVKLLALDNQRQRVLTEDEIELLLNRVSEQPKTYLFLMVAIFTGARPQAILNLQRKHISFSQNKITFMAMKKRPPYSVAIHHRLYNVLKEWTSDLKENDFVFYPENPAIDKSIHISYSGIKKTIQPTMDLLFNKGLLANDRINKVTLYTLRHSFGTLLSNHGANAFVIKELMNHAKFDTTNRYVKVSQQETVKYINAIL